MFFRSEHDFINQTAEKQSLDCAERCVHICVVLGWFISIHGDLLSDSVLAVVVLNLECGQVFARKYNLKNFYKNNPDSMFCDAVLRDLCSISKKRITSQHIKFHQNLFLILHLSYQKMIV